ncbi:MAG: hypothetical protein F8N37_00885 [Telmatospirillum sp.]|nr:hypothetical protein [Telmatospirillum sp.]
MATADLRPCAGVTAVLASMHAKERAIAPVLEAGLGLVITPAVGLNTDQFGTFSRDIARTGSPSEAARAKIAAGFDVRPDARIGIASEGCFGPHPQIPFLAQDTELVLLCDRDSGLELAGYHATLETNFGHTLARTVEDAMAFAERSGFPGHGVIVMGSRDGHPDPAAALAKDIRDGTALAEAVRSAIRRFGAAWVETDMRAHRNPTRMTAIGRAARDLVRRFHSRCPDCGRPGFDVTELLAGLPCACCGEPTAVAAIAVLVCPACGCRRERSVSSDRTADPARCGLCNP